MLGVILLTNLCLFASSLRLVGERESGTYEQMLALPTTALEIGEENGHRAVGGGVAAQIRPLVLGRRRHRVERGCTRGGLDALRPELEREAHVDQAVQPQCLGRRERDIRKLSPVIPTTDHPRCGLTSNELTSYMYDMAKPGMSAAISVRISTVAARRLQTRARARGVSTSALIRDLLEHEAGPVKGEPSALELTHQWVGAVRSRTVPAGRTARQALTGWLPDRRG